MILEVRQVGRKTPSDGRLDLSPSTFRRLEIIGAALRGRVGDVTAAATLERRECSRCATHTEGAGEHLFLSSEAFKALVAGEHCVVALTEDGVTIEVARPHPLAP
jgi:hypothetical protein